LQHAPAPSVVSRQPSQPQDPRGRLETADYPAMVDLPMPPPTATMRHGRTSSGEFGDGLDRMDSLSDVDSQYAPAPPRRRLGGWIVGAVLLAGVGVIAYKVATPYLQTASKTTTHKALDQRTEQFLTEGESAFREGNLELAKEKFDKASALDEGDARVLLDVARLAAARADVPWLKTRVLPESAEDELRAAKQELTDLGATAKRTADAAATAAPDDVPALRARVDALRIVGERDAARGYVTKIIANASQPETSYVLAALDLAEIDPLWSTVIDRLRVAAAGEGNAGRARAALVYALARSGDATGAKSELDRLAALPTPYPLLPALRAFVARAPAGKGPAAAASGSARVAAGGVPSAAPSAVDFESLPRRPVGGGGGGGSASEEPSGGGDPRDLLRQAAAAENRGQFPRATKLYEDAMHADPANSEALAGLGSVSLKTGDYASARSYFGHALGLNPNFVPALVGQADAMWAEGDHAGAVARYKEIVDRFPESSGYPSYVKTRAEGSSSGSTGAAPAAPHTEVPATPAAAAPTAKAPLPPGTTLPLPADLPSDLPGTPP
jgi:tetratricopeptide (TPR) repeat protein